MTGHTVADLLSKNAWGMIGHFLRLEVRIIGLSSADCVCVCVCVCVRARVCVCVCVCVC
jgi:hypothetical protein